MKSVTAILRSFLISPELLVAVAGFALWSVFPHWFDSLSKRIVRDAEMLKHLGLLPSVLVAVSMSFSKSILMPEADKRHLLQSWSDYGLLKATVYVGLFYSVAYAGLGIVTLLFDWTRPAAHHSAVLLISVAGGLAVTITLFCASIKAEELLRRHFRPE